MRQLFAKKPLTLLLEEMAGEHRLRRVLGPIQLTSLGVGCIIGAGIFVLVGEAASHKAGPALMLSFAVAGVACIFAALCYAEFASMIPVAGSAYTYAYATLGELLAWVIGWDLVLEYSVASATVAHGWSKYFQAFIGMFHLKLPAALAEAPLLSDPATGRLILTGSLIDLPALVIAAIVTTVLVIGIRESATFNAVMVIVKVAIVLFVIAVGVFFINPKNWQPFAPYGYTGVSFFGKTLLGRSPLEAVLPPELRGRAFEIQKLMEKGRPLAGVVPAKHLESEADRWKRLRAAGKPLEAVLPPELRDRAPEIGARLAGGETLEGLVPAQYLESDVDRWRKRLASGPLGMLAGAAVIFFAYIGFDSVSTHAEEARNPRRDVPIGIIASLVLCTFLYIGVTAVITGMVPYDRINPHAPVADAFRQIGLPWAQFIISLGAVAGITSVLLVLMLSQPRVLLAMARDGLLPTRFFGAVHDRFRTPWKSTILTGVFVGLMAALLPLRVLAELVNIGTLLAFVIVCAAVLIMRRTHPEAERPFRVPFVPLVPILGMGLCLLLMFSLPWQSWARLGAWLLAGFVIYFAYSRRHSHLARHLSRELGAHGVSPGGALTTGVDDPPATGSP